MYTFFMVNLVLFVSDFGVGFISGYLILSQKKIFCGNLKLALISVWQACTILVVKCFCKNNYVLAFVPFVTLLVFTFAISRRQKTVKFFRIYAGLVAYLFMYDGAKLLAGYFINLVALRGIYLEYLISFLLFAGVGAAILDKTIKIASEKKVTIKLTIGNTSITLKALCDTGNLLVDTLNRNPVFVISKSALLKAKNGNELLNNLPEYNLHSVNYTTVSGYCSSMEVFHPSFAEVFINGKFVKLQGLSVGLVDKKFKKFDGIVNLDLVRCVC